MPRYNPFAVNDRESNNTSVRDRSNAPRVLLVKLSSLGDVVHSLPLAAALRAGLGPEAHIAWAVGKAFAPLLEGNPNISAVHLLPSKGFGDVVALGGTLRAKQFDTALDAQGLFVSGAVTLLSGAKRRIGYDAGREGNRLFLTEPIVPNRERKHVVQRLLGFCNALGIARPTRIDTQEYLRRPVADGLLESVEQQAGPLVGCIVGASVANKTWPAERWVETLRWLDAQGMRTILLGAKNETDAAATIAGDAGGAVSVNLVGKTGLRDLASVLAACDVVIGPDSGPTHLAVAVGTPVVGLYGVTDPARTGVDWAATPTITLDFATKDAPPETRRARHPTLTDAIARIPVSAVTDAVCELLQQHSRKPGVSSDVRISD